MPPPKNVPVEDRDLWKVYTNAIAETLVPNRGDLKDNYAVYIPPFLSQAIPAGDSVPAEIMREGVYNCADMFLPADSPVYSQAGNYSKLLLRYLGNVKLDGNGSKGDQQQLQKLQWALDDANQKFLKIDGESQVAYSKFGQKANYDLAGFIAQYYPQWQKAADAQDVAAANIEMLLAKIGGPQGIQWTQDVKNAKSAVQGGAIRGTNMKTSIQQATTVIGDNKEPIPPTADSIRIRPSYVMDAAYTSKVSGWIEEASKNNPKQGWKKTAKLSSSANTNWSDIGFSQDSVKVGDNFWFFRASWTENGKEHSEQISASEASADVIVEVSAIGAQAFSVHPDSTWDVDNLKKTYPNLLDKSPQELLEPKALITSMLIGYGIGFNIKLDTKLVNRIQTLLEKSRSKNGSASLFGFNIAESSSSSSSTVSYDDVKQMNGGSGFTVKPSNDGWPTLLGVLARKIW